MKRRRADTELAELSGYSNFQKTALVLLRVFIGWHFLYEGLAKLINPYWTSAGYLADSQWWLGGLFLQIATKPAALAVVDFLNVWGLIFIGLGLMAGFLTRPATIAGIVLLALYYVAAPPFGYTYAMPAEGSYLIVNKVLIELVALCVLLAFPTSRVFGLDGMITLEKLMFWKRKSLPATPGDTPAWGDVR